MHRTSLLVLLLSCRASDVTPTSATATHVASTPDAVAPSASSAAAPPARRAHADGPKGSVEIVLCRSATEIGLGLELTPKLGAPWRVMLQGAAAATPDERIRFVDVDHDGFPDPVLTDASRKKPAVAFVYLTGQSGGPSKSCSVGLSVDHGSEGFIVGAETLDDAVTALAAVPNRGLTDPEACAAIDRTAPRSDVAVYGYPDYDGAIARRIKSGDAVTTCHAKVPDGPGFLHPVFVCDAFRPYCEFGLASGDTTIPPSERRYWFDATAHQLVTVAMPQP